MKKNTEMPFSFNPIKLDGDEYMNVSQHEHFKEILTNWKQSLMSGVDDTVPAYER